MKTNSVLRILLCVMLVVLSLFTFGACSQTPDNTADVQELEYEIERLGHDIERLERQAEELEATIHSLENTSESLDNHNACGHTHVLQDCDDYCVELELPELWAEITGVSRFKLGHDPEHNNFNTPEHVRIFKNGNANIRLLDDGTFIANLFHNTIITGTYTEMTDGHEIAVLFTYSGVNNISRGVSSFESTGHTTVVGGIVDDVMTIPIDWDDGHGHGMDFVYSAYPLVFIGENDQRIILHADNTFDAHFANDVVIIGFYGLRAASITFVPGSPTFDRYGVPVGTFLVAELRTCGDDSFSEHTHGNDDDCDFDDYGTNSYDNNDSDIDTEQNTMSSAENPTQNTTPAVTPIPIQAQTQELPPSPPTESNPTQSPTEDTPTPTETPETPAPTETPVSTETSGNDDENNTGLDWCDECEVWH